jgi:hypothetical protein
MKAWRRVSPLDDFTAKFGQVLLEKLQNPSSPFTKGYLDILVDEIVVKDKVATIKGSHSSLVSAIKRTQPCSLSEVPTFNMDWRAYL